MQVCSCRPALTHMGYGRCIQASYTLSGRTIDHSHETRLMSSQRPLGELVSLELTVGAAQAGLLASRLQCIEVGSGQSCCCAVDQSAHNRHTIVTQVNLVHRCRHP